MEKLNALGLPWKYTILTMAGATVANPIFYYAGFYPTPDAAVTTPLVAAVGGYLGGYARQQIGYTD